MMFGYQVNEHVTLKILEEREGGATFKLVDAIGLFRRVLAICRIYNGSYAQ